MSQPKETINKESEDLITTQDLLEGPVESDSVAIAHSDKVSEDIFESNDVDQTEEELARDDKELENLEVDEPAEEELDTMELAMEEDSEQVDKEQTTESKKAKPSTQNRISELPLARVKHIIKLDPEVNLVNAEAVFLITKATESFIKSLSKESYGFATQQKKKTITKAHVDQALQMLPIEL